MEKYFMTLAMGVILNLFAHSQKRITSPLWIGDSVPEMKFSEISNLPTGIDTWSEIKKPLTIFYFWATNCKGCLLSFPKLEKLQAQNKKDLQIVLVNKQSIAEIETNYARLRKFNKNLGVPNVASITKDTQLNNYFKHISIPHSVWIDKQGKVFAITDGSDITEENILNYFKGVALDLPEKVDLMDYEPEKALLPQSFDFAKDPVKYYSTFMSYFPWLPPGNLYMVDSLRNRFIFTYANQSILELFLISLGTVGPYQKPLTANKFEFGKRLILDGVDSILFYCPKDMKGETWRKKYSLSYESMLPLPQTKERVHKRLFSDLCEFLGLEANIETRNMPCYALVQIDSSNEKHKYISGKTFQHLDTVGNYILNNSKMESFREMLSMQNPTEKRIFVDNTGIKHRLNLKLNTRLDNISKLRIELREKYGLDIIKVDQIVEVFVIKKSQKQ